MDQLQFDFTGKVAIASGAASGMGLAFCRSFAACGGSVVMADIHREAVEACASELEKTAPGRVKAVECDVRMYEQVVAACATAVETFGRLDVVVNFAGGTARRVLGVDAALEFPDVPIEVYDWGLDVNMRGQFYFCHAAARIMREQRCGLIVNIGSVTGVEGCAGGQDYPTAKAGVMYGLTKSVAQFGAPYGIRCVCVSPGPVLTRADMGRMPTLLGRAAEPQEVVDLILYIASEKGRFINGDNIMIDGGRSAMPRPW